MRRSCILALFVACLVGLPAGTSVAGVGAGPHVRPADVAGAIVLRGDGAEGEFETGAFLEPGSEVSAEGERPVLLLSDGTVLRGPGSFQVPEPEPEPHPVFRLLRALLGSSSAADRDAHPGFGEVDVTESAAPLRPMRPMRPRGDHAVRTLTPRFVWRSVEDATAYRVHLHEEGHEILVHEVADTAWTLPAESALSPGGTYEWFVTPVPETGTGPRVRFGIASREVLDGVAEELGRLRDMGLDPEVEGLLPSAALFRSMGLPYDALAALEELSRTDDRWSGKLESFHARLLAELHTPDAAAAAPTAPLDPTAPEDPVSPERSTDTLPSEEERR